MGIKKTSYALRATPAPKRAPDPDSPDEDIPTIPDPREAPAPRTDEFVFRDTQPRLYVVKPPR